MSEREKAFETACRDYLTRIVISELRAFGRHKGVKNPTEYKRKEELIQAVIDIYLGKVAPVPRPTRGAPIRADYFDPAIEKTVDGFFEEYQRSIVKKESFQDILQAIPRNTIRVKSPEAEMLEDKPISVQLEYRKGRWLLLPFAYELKKFTLYVYQNLVEEFGLREGDVLTCTVKQEQGGKEFLMESLIAVNGQSPLSINRLYFETADVCYPEKQIRLNGDDALEKFVNWFAPLGAGQRYIISAPSKAGKTQILKRMALAISNAEEYESVVLLVEQSPETVAEFRRCLGEERLVATTYGEEPETLVVEAERALMRAKRYAEMGKDAVLFIDGLIDLALAYNEIAPDNSGKTPIVGLEGITVRYIKKFFASARNFFEDGSLTIVATLKEDSGNPSADFLAVELADMANAKLALSDNLARKKIFPAIDFLSSSSDQSEQLLGKSGACIEREARKIFSVLPKERVLELLMNADTPRSFVEVAKKNP